MRRLLVIFLTISASSHATNGSRGGPNGDRNRRGFAGLATLKKAINKSHQSFQQQKRNNNNIQKENHGGDTQKEYYDGNKIIDNRRTRRSRMPQYQRQQQQYEEEEEPKDDDNYSSTAAAAAKLEAVAGDKYFSSLDDNDGDELDLSNIDSRWKSNQEQQRQSRTNGGGIDNNIINDSLPSHLVQSNLLQVPCGIQVFEEHHNTKNRNPSSSYSSNADIHTSSSRSASNNNKITQLSAFVDTGAQVTVLSRKAASKANLLHLIDRRYAGRATGVGQCRVLGRIPANSIQFCFGNYEEENDVVDYSDDDYYDDIDDDHHFYGNDNKIMLKGPAITVIESTGTEGVDLLIGLDFLRDHRSILSLKDDTMTLFCDNSSSDHEQPITIPFINKRASTETTKPANIYGEATEDGMPLSHDDVAGGDISKDNHDDHYSSQDEYDSLHSSFSQNPSSQKHNQYHQGESSSKSNQNAGEGLLVGGAATNYNYRNSIDKGINIPHDIDHDDDEDDDFDCEEGIDMSGV